MPAHLAINLQSGNCYILGEILSFTLNWRAGTNDHDHVFENWTLDKIKKQGDENLKKGRNCSKVKACKNNWSSFEKKYTKAQQKVQMR
ncbi:MAG: hypothetical protein JXB07_00990 [Anaerolineae bacterium]|nr:hypothetical protein [Anaerolineae bacterium]